MGHSQHLALPRIKFLGAATLCGIGGIANVGNCRSHSCSVSSKGVLGKGVGNNKNASEMRQKCIKNAPKWVLLYFIEFFRERPGGATTLPHFSKCSRPFVQSVKSTLSYLKSCNPVGGTRQALLEYWEKRNVPKCVHNASKMRQTPLGENTLWTIPTCYQMCPASSNTIRAL